MLHRLFGAHGHKGCRCRGGDYVTRVIQMEQGKPDAPPFRRQVLPRGTLLGQRVKDAGESECRSVMERIGIATSSRCESRQTSSLVVVDERTYRIFAGGCCK